MSKNIHEAILAIMNKVGIVEKDGQMKGAGSYKFASEAAFIQALRPAMLEEGVIVYPSGLHSPTVSTYETKGGATMNLVDSTHEFTFVHAASQTEIKVEVRGMGADSGDKAANKAMTAALKYGLRQTFLIETGDDPDLTPSTSQARGKQLVWSIAQKEAVEKNTKEVSNVDVFLNKSGLPITATAKDVTGFTKAFQGGIDQGMDKKAALKYAKEQK